MIYSYCPAGWKEPLGKNWQGVLDFIIVCESPESYIPQQREVPRCLDSHIRLGAQKSSLQRRMRKEYGIEWKDIPDAAVQSRMNWQKWT